MTNFLITTAVPIALCALTERWVLARGYDTSSLLTSGFTGCTFNSDRDDLSA